MSPFESSRFVTLSSGVFRLIRAIHTATSGEVIRAAAMRPPPITSPSPMPTPFPAVN
ncbi:hypothetical protein RvY_01931 [Ramazzottius varieornatus]|uniref:Uncharacterized protein n=1 Tax=Ramazzottius varieornatus TaxID=947166 RepID=A0A1D1UI52_RAMVA|nr:hypothetical protein RvY_01931 [Ramazzottius varieornatus]